MDASLTVDELMLELGTQLRAQRLRLNLTIEEVARHSGVSINVVRRLEAGEGSTLHSFVAVLKTLRRQDWLTSLQPPVTIDPLAMLRRKAPRQRASRPRTPRTEAQKD